jgi:hypothetical protein
VAEVLQAVKREVSREGSETLEEVLRVEQGDLGEEVRWSTGKKQATTLGQWEFSWV